jgi:uncharacterized protein (DUF2062 family)
VPEDPPSLTSVTPPPVPYQHGWLYRRTILPILALLRVGASPERLAWSIAAGLVIGINPLPGSATLLCLAVAAVFRLNVAASQVANYAIYPLQLLLFVPFLHVGTKVFHTAPPPLTPAAIMEEAKRHPLDLMRELWRWEWHALVVWAVLGLAAAPLIALAVRPLLHRLLHRVQRQDSIVST